MCQLGYGALLNGVTDVVLPSSLEASQTRIYVFLYAEKYPQHMCSTAATPAAAYLAPTVVIDGVDVIRNSAKYLIYIFILIMKYCNVLALAGDTGTCLASLAVACYTICAADRSDTYCM